MVGSYYDEGLVRVCQIELIDQPHRLVHVPCLADSGSRVVGVAGVVDHAALYHHEEALVAVVEEQQCRLHNLRQRQIAGFAVDGIRQVVTVFGALVVGGLHQDQFVQLGVGLCGCRHIRLDKRLRLFVAVGDGVAFLFRQTVQVDFLVVALALRVVESCAAEEIKTAFAQLLTDLVILVAFGYVGVESGRRGVVDSDGGHDTHTPSLLFQLLGNRGEGVAIFVQTESPVGRFAACCQTRTRSGGVGDTVAFAERGGLTRIRKSGHQRLHATQRLALQRRAVHLGCQYLVGAHAVTDKIEHVLQLRRSTDSDRNKSGHKKETFHIIGNFWNFRFPVWLWSCCAVSCAGAALVVWRCAWQPVWRHAPRVSGGAEA